MLEIDTKKSFIKLKTTDNWRKWLEQLRTEASKENIWEYIDPDRNRMILEPAPLKPIEPAEPVITEENEAREEALWRKYAAQMDAYEIKLAQYEKHKKRMTDIRSYIIDTIDVEHKPLIKEIFDVAEMIRALEEKLAPKPNWEKTQLSNRYHELAIAKRGIRPKELSAKWREFMVDMQFANFDNIKPEQLARDFVNSTEHVLPEFYTLWSTNLLQFDLDSSLNTLKKVPTVEKLLNEFDVWSQRTKKQSMSSRTDIMMATLDGKSDQPQKPSEGQRLARSKKLICIDGEEHRFEECPYLNPEKRTADWKPDPEIQAKFDYMARNRDSSIGRKIWFVKKRLGGKKDNKLKATSSTNTGDSGEPTERANFANKFEHCGMVLPMSMSFVGDDSMKDDWILDTGSTIHITNNRARIRNIGSDEKWVLVGDTTVKAIGPGEATLFPTDPIDSMVRTKGIRLLEVWYVKDMHTNIISAGRLKEHGIVYNGMNDRLYSKRTNQYLCNVKTNGKLFYIEWQPNSNPKNYMPNELAMSSFEKRTLKDPALVWHKRYGHVSAKAIKKLEEATEGAIVTTNEILNRNEDGFMEKCEVCELTDARRQISRVKMTTPTRPFQVLFVDIIVMNLAINGDSYALHAVCPYTKFHAIITTRTKSVNYDMETLIEHIEHTFKITVEEIHVDGEPSITGMTFEKYCRDRKKRLTITVPDTPEQNGPAEKAGHTISKRARSMIIEANLRMGLWPEAMKAAVWITNRTPIKALGWKTPYEMAYGKKPYVGNLFLFGAKAYVRIDTEKSEKMAPRAQIGFLVGYEAHNIWRIWVTGPNGSKVIRARDVVFDETKKYDPEHPFAREIVREGVSQIIDNIVIPNIDEASNDVVFDSVNDDMLLQRRSVSARISTTTKGNTAPTENVQTGQIFVPPAQNMEIDAANPPERMEIDENGINEAKNMVIHQNRDEAMVESSKIDSTGGVEIGRMEMVEVQPQGEQISGLWRNQPLGNGLTNNPENQSRQFLLPAPEERDSANQNSSIEMTHQSDDLTPPTNGLIRQEALGSSENIDDDMATPLLSEPPNEPMRIEYTDPHQHLSAVNADLTEANIVTGPRIRKASKRALSPEAAPLSSKRRRKQERAFFVRKKLQNLSTLEKTFLAAAEKIENSPISRFLPPEPRNWTGALRHQFAKQFIQAARDEFDSLKKKGTFEVVPKKQGMQILPLTWVFKYKFDKFGKLAKFKARICVRGDLQAPNDLATRAATLAARIFRTIIALAAVFDLEIVQYDAVNAFVNSELDEEVYTYFPDGFKEKEQVLKLKRALYGLRRSPRLWQQELTRTLLDLGFEQVPDEECLFVRNGVILLFFVDDILIFYDKAKNQRLFEEIERGLMAKYELRKMEKFEWFLNIRVVRDRAQRKIWLCQDAYITKIAERFGLNTTNSVRTPISTDIEASAGEATNAEIHAFQELVGSALYAAIMTRPDVAKAVNELAKHCKNPSKAHFQQIRRVIQYLFTTRFLAIEYSPPTNSGIDAFVCASDASFGDNDDRTSSEGYLVQLYGGPVDWKANKQRFVTTSTTEAELRAATEAAKRLQVWKRIFESIRFVPDRELSILCDNKQTVSLLTSQEPQFRTNLKHVDIYHHWLRQEVQAQRLRIEWVDTKGMIADGFTKILRGQRFLEWRQHQGLTDIATLLQE